jgi:FkbM family methyltransferase
MPNFVRLLASVNLVVLKTLLRHISAEDRAWLGGSMIVDRSDRGTAALADVCNRVVLAWKNKQYDVTRNGEASLLTWLRPLGPKVLVDVGANVGDWSLAACEALPDAVVHAFEIAVTTFEVLRRNAARLEGRLVLNAMGLGETEGEITLYYSPQSSTATSTIREAIEVSATEHGIRDIAEVTAKIVTGDSYVQSRGIAHVDVLKIDVEGAEFSVLRGFDETFARGAVDVVQFEYGAINLATRDFLEDYFRFFTERGFIVGKLYPEGVAFKPYEVTDEDFTGPNYIACRTERQDIVAALRGPRPLIPGMPGT